MKKEDVKALLKKTKHRKSYWTKPTAGHKRTTFYIREKILIDFKVQCGARRKTLTEAINEALSEWTYEEL